MFRIPGTKLALRTFDRVETTDSQYDIFDVGVQYEDGSIDGVVVGGSFATVKNAVSRLNSDADRKEAKKAAKKARKAAKTAVDAAMTTTSDDQLEVIV